MKNSLSRKVMLKGREKTLNVGFLKTLFLEGRLFQICNALFAE